MKLGGYTQTALGVRLWVLSLAAAIGTATLAWAFFGEFGTDLAHIVLYLSIFISVFVLGNIRIELNSGLYSFQISILVPLLSFVNLEENLQAGFVFWSLGLIASCLLADRRNAMIVRYSSLIFCGAVFIGAYVLLRHWEAVPMLSAWAAAMVSLLTMLGLYTVSTYSIDEVTGRKGLTVKLRLSQLTLAIILISALAIMGVWVQQGFGIVAIAETGSGGRAALFLLIITLLLYSMYSRTRRRMLQRRFEGITNAAMQLPWADDNEAALQRLLELSAKAIPNSKVRLQETPPGLGEVGSRVDIPELGQRFLVVSRNPGGSPFTALEQRVIEAIGHMGTETMRTKTEKTELVQEANTDALTGLANYRALQVALDEAKNRNEHNVAMVFIDLDDFKSVNDEYGHSIGNEVLQAVARRIQGTIRPNDLATRIGGDEFVVLLRRIDSSAEVDEIVQRIKNKLSPVISVRGGQLLKITASFGISIPKGKVDLNTLMSESDERMYEMKRSRQIAMPEHSFAGNGDPSFGTDLERIILEAVTEERISIALQPIVDIQQNTIVGVESLVRYRDAEVGSIPAVILVNIVQQLGILDQLTEQVLERSFIEFAEIQRLLPEINILHVNFEVEQILNDDIFNLILEYNSKHPDINFCIELTENSLNQASPEVIERLAKIRSDTLSVAIDDFGKSYSSLRALVHYPIDVVKIDKSLADDLLIEEERSSYIILALHELSEALKYMITVEGVEHDRQVQILKRIGMRYAQGYYFARPMTIRQLTDRIRIYGDTGRIDSTLSESTTPLL